MSWTDLAGTVGPRKVAKAIDRAFREWCDALGCGESLCSDGLSQCRNRNAHVPTHPNAGVLNAKYLIENFVISNVSNAKVLGDGFAGYSGKVGGGLDVVLRSMTQLSKSVKIT